MMSRYRILKQGHKEILDKDYLERLWMAGIPAVFKSKQEVFEGMISGVTELGELIVKVHGNRRTFGHGEISMDVNSGIS
jgi:biotin-(acetyl-CoA carboxylase) ligase